MPMITLQPVTADNFVECIELTPTADQQACGYVSPNVLSLAQAYVERWWIPLAVYAEATMIGFVLHGRWPQGGFAAFWGDKPKPGIDYILWMMIDSHYQRQGYGKATLTALIERIKTQPDCLAIELDYDRENTAAARLYTGCGFQPIKENEDGEILARLRLHAG
jgi:diamine N-acetyltransferase